MSWRYEDMRDGEKRVLGVVIIVVLIGGVGWLGGVLKRDEPHDTVSPTQDAASPHNSANLNQLLAGLSCRQMKNPEGYLYRTVCESQNFPIVNERTDNSW